MRARNWRVSTLTEFYPSQQNLLGLNVNRGQKICLRLRYPGDQNQNFMLYGINYGRSMMVLTSKGYTGEGFLSEGKSLGGRKVPRHEARRLARIAAEKRQNGLKGSDQKLGGRPVPYGTDIRKVIVDAIERRNKVLKGLWREQDESYRD
ncbi:hypothetical protein DID88_008596 [Monilinia fructigena]|uniref:WLM domain-containing protein n=1 Tax=Monilinia fructigena TaxID=38457 RepID=A0A395J6A1_9HELO|nr:hypothetical protein DID88_008596 [Monilinia fructigena]